MTTTNLDMAAHSRLSKLSQAGTSSTPVPCSGDNKGNVKSRGVTDYLRRFESAAKGNSFSVNYTDGQTDTRPVTIREAHSLHATTIEQLEKEIESLVNTPVAGNATAETLAVATNGKKAKRKTASAAEKRAKKPAPAQKA